MALILVKYGTDHPIEKLKIENARAEDKIVFIQNGVFWALKKVDTKAKTFAIKDDFLARGYDEKDSQVPLIDYSQFIEIVESEPQFIG